jgi:DNA replication protein DnaC
MTTARFPVEKTLDEFNLDESSMPPSYLITLDWINRADNLCLVGPAGTGKTHYLIALGRAAVEAGHRVRYYTAAELVEHLWRATADNTVGKTIETRGGYSRPVVAIRISVGWDGGEEIPVGLAGVEQRSDPV